MKVRVCPKCGQHNQENAWTCGNCGYTLSVNSLVELDNRSDTEPKREWTCQNCGKKNHNNRDTCWSCSTIKGGVLNEEMAEPSSTQQIEYLLQDLQSKSVSVRERAIEELGKLKVANNQQVINALRDVATLDSDNHIKEAAKETLYTLGYEVSGAIRKIPPKTDRASQEVFSPEYKSSGESTGRFIYCSQCGTKLSQDAKFCYKCGNPIESSMGGTKAKTNVSRGSSNPPKEERDRPKTIPTCAVPGCTYNANRRCDKCGKAFCVNHIGSSYLCDTCRTRMEIENQVHIEKVKSGGRVWGIVYLVGALVLCGLSFNVYSSTGSFGIFGSLLGLGAILLGFLALGGFLVNR